MWLFVVINFVNVMVYFFSFVYFKDFVNVILKLDVFILKEVVYFFYDMRYMYIFMLENIIILILNL